MHRIAVFPGSFDPFTRGHEEIVRRGLRVFDEVIIAIGESLMKKPFLSIDARMALISKVFSEELRVSVDTYKGLTVDFCKKVHSDFIIRGLRTAADFEYERAIGQANRSVNPNVETFFVLTSPTHTFISSTIVRDIYKNGGDVTHLLPEGINTENLREWENMSRI